MVKRSYRSGPVVTRWWWLRHAPCQGPAGLIHGPDAAADTDNRFVVEQRRRQLPKQALWLTSGMLRATQTVKALTHVPPLPVPDLAEQDFGAWTGHGHGALWESGEPLYRAFWDDPAQAVPPGGESFAGQCARVQAAVARLTTEHAGMDLVAVAHAGTIRAALALALDLAPAAALRVVVEPWSLTRLEQVEGAWRVVQVNAS